MIHYALSVVHEAKLTGRARQKVNMACLRHSLRHNVGSTAVEAAKTLSLIEGVKHVRVTAVNERSYGVYRHGGKVPDES